MWSKYSKFINKISMFRHLGCLKGIIRYKRNTMVFQYHDHCIDVMSMRWTSENLKRRVLQKKEDYKQVLTLVLLQYIANICSVYLVWIYLFPEEVWKWTWMIWYTTSSNCKRMSVLSADHSMNTK